jgi:hypothetical protein
MNVAGDSGALDAALPDVVTLARPWLPPVPDGLRRAQSG